MVPLTVASAPSLESSRHVEAGAIRKLPHHRLGHRDFRVIELRLVFEDGNGEGMDGIGQMSGGSEGVISATGNGKQSKCNQQNKRTAHAVPIVAFRPAKSASQLRFRHGSGMMRP